MAWWAIMIKFKFKIKTWEMGCSAVTIHTETTQEGSVLSASKRSLGSLCLPLSLSPFMLQPPLLPPLLLDLTLSMLVLFIMAMVLLLVLLPLLPLSHSPSQPTQPQLLQNLEAILVTIIVMKMTSTTQEEPGFRFSWRRRRRK